VLERVGREVGYTRKIRVEQGPEFVSRDLKLWAQKGVTLDFSRPGKPTDNAFIESPERQISGEMPERALVFGPRRRAAKMRGLAQSLLRFVHTARSAIAFINQSGSPGPP
jgi:transposase InsO family protein